MISGSNILIFGRPVPTTYAQLYIHDYIHVPSHQKRRILPKAAELYALGLTLRQIAKELRVSKTKVLNTLHRAGLVLRPQTKDRKNIPAGRNKPHVGVTPYGYDRLRGILIVNGKEIETVRLILKLWQEGGSFAAIARHLNGLEIKNRKGGQWDRSVIRSIVNRHKKDPKLIEELIKWTSSDSGK